MNYQYRINEEIVRWSFEIYITSHNQYGWQVAFTNPTAGPWKKVIDPSTNEEIYRFNREEARPDLILINSKLNIVLIVEAKDDYTKLLSKEQMAKSIIVFHNIAKVYNDLHIAKCNAENKPLILPSFLWYSRDSKTIKTENRDVTNVFNKYSKGTHKLFNIVILSGENNVLFQRFIYDDNIYDDICDPWKRLKH